MQAPSGTSIPAVDTFNFTMYAAEEEEWPRKDVRFNDAFVRVLGALRNMGGMPGCFVLREYG